MMEERIMPLDSNKIIDLNIDAIEKTQIRINGRNDCMLELNLSDLGIAERLEIGYEKLQQHITKIAEVNTDEDNFVETLKKADKEMREVMDYIFDAPVSEVCAKGGTMYDPKDGQYRFEAIIDALTKLYENNINEEYKAMKKRIKQNADKYIPQDHKPKTKSKSVQRREKIQKGEDFE